jgi:Zinc carboxypeptidase
VLASTGASAQVTPLQTRAEATHYRETSTYADTMAFVTALANARRVTLTTIGKTGEGRAMPLVIASRPLVATPAQALALGRPIVYVQANIHAGEVEGKEAVLAMLRDLTATSAPNILDRIVLLVEPIYNADGNEKFASQAINRTEQNGPESVGTRANGANLDLNRDYIKAEAPETRASLAAFNAWNPDVFVDLHTTDGSFHGYALTYSPSLAIGDEVTGYVKAAMLPAIRAKMAARGFPVFDYGNFEAPGSRERENLLDVKKPAWSTYDWRPRFGTNYFGLRKRISILSEAFSHDPFERRIASTRAFVEEILDYTADHVKLIRGIYKLAEENRVMPRRASWRMELTKHPEMLPVLVERLVSAPTPETITEPGVPKGIKRTGEMLTQTMPVYRQFDETMGGILPAAYILPDDSALLGTLAVHGIIVERIPAAQEHAVETFTIASIDRAAQPFQGHRTVSLNGTWARSRATVAAGTPIVFTAQPLGAVAAVLLEPQSDDGLVTWNRFDDALTVGAPFTIKRLLDR